ncbi:helix-turn-helix domain-containing protein [Microbacterium karelineae]|uniref:helix-turn-helix domain-containing protein n=1 Tax=Microbacterium karelineae TaxID=2654283 RepID=UPI0012EA7E2A|nr:helix-turn-helix domain-containing protein [Microbacterium karelineae]
MGRFDVSRASALIRAARADAALTQAELARRAGLRQPSLAQMESGARGVSPEMLERVLRAADFRPSLSLAEHASEISRLAAEHGLTNVRVFGSVLRGDDHFDSDIDLLVTADPRVDLFDIALFADRVQRLTGFHVDVVSDSGESRVARSAGSEAVALS